MLGGRKLGSMREGEVMVVILGGGLRRAEGELMVGIRVVLRVLILVPICTSTSLLIINVEVLMGLHSGCLFLSAYTCPPSELWFVFFSSEDQHKGQGDNGKYSEAA